MAARRGIPTLDGATNPRLRQPGERLARHARIGGLSEQERLRILKTLDDIMARRPSRSEAEVNRELRAIRQARRTGGRRCGP